MYSAAGLNHKETTEGRLNGVTTELYDLVKKSKEDERALQLVIELFEPKLKKSLSLTNYQERENLSQELKYKLVIVIKDYDINSTPGFWDLKEQMEKQQEVIA